MKSIEIKSKRVADTYEYTFKDGTYRLLLDKRGIPFGLEKPDQAIYLFDTITYKGKDITVLAFIGGAYPSIIAGSHNGLFSVLLLDEGELKIDEPVNPQRSYYYGRCGGHVSSTNDDYSSAIYKASCKLRHGELSLGGKLGVLLLDAANERYGTSIEGSLSSIDDLVELFYSVIKEDQIRAFAKEWIEANHVE